jgi:hypothetical protein
MTATPWPYRVSAETIAAALRAVDTLYEAGRAGDADAALWRLRKRVGQEAIDRVRAMPVVAGQGSLFGGEAA